VAQGLEINVARAAFYPDVTLTGAFGVESMVLKSLLSPQAAAFSLAGNLAQPIFNGGALQGQLDLQKSIYKELLVDYRKQILTAFSDVENGLIGLDKTGRQVELQRQAVVQAQKAYDVALGRLQEGTIDIVTLATIETTLFQAEDLLVQVRSAHFQAATTLYQALGGGWTQPPHNPEIQAAVANQTG
jgi:outer membrane protein TolC